MIELTIDNIKEIASKILFDFDRVCRQNNIRYSIAYGTLLGAVRHKGFIPWDDDIDIIISRQDYNKFLNHQLELSDSYKLISIENNNRFMAPLAKIIDRNTILYQSNHGGEKVELGVYIDVFVLDYIPNKKTSKKLLYKTLGLLQKCWSFCENSPAVGNRSVLGVLRKIVNKTYFARFFSLIMISIAKRQKESDNYSNLLYSVYNRFCQEIEKKVLDNIVDYEFEGHLVMGIKESDAYLKKIYNDYMKLPPIEKQVTHHNYYAYYRM